MILEPGMSPTALPLPGCFGPTDMWPGWATELTSGYPTRWPPGSGPPDWLAVPVS